MPKITIASAVRDPLRANLGKSKIVQNYSFEKSRLTNAGDATLKASFVDKKINDKGFLFEEITTLKLEPLQETSRFNSFVKSVISLNSVYSDYFMSLQAPQPLSSVEAVNLNKTVSSYDVVTNFNYVSKDYDDLQRGATETDLPSILDNKLKRDFLDFKTKRVKSPLNFSLEQKKMQNFVIPNSGPRKQTDLNASVKLDSFPYYNQIKIANKVNNKFSSFVNDIEVFDPVLDSYLKGEKISIDLNIQVGERVTENKKIGVFDLLSWAEGDAFDISDNFYSLNPDSINQSKMITDFKKMLLTGYVRNLSKGTYRSYEDIYNNQECYIEDFVYSLEKFKDSTVGTPSQSFYIPAVDDVSLLNDTQIKYDALYYYKCQAHYVIVGNKYKYQNLRFHNEDGNEYALVEVVNKPDIIIIPFEMFTEGVRTIQPPPIFPQVKFVTENNSNSRIDIYLFPTKGELVANFIPVQPGDQAQIDKMRMNSVEKEGKVRFRTMPEDGLFEIYKMHTPPESYSDFKDFKLSEIRMPYASDDAIFRDNVIPNTENNYYMFRKVNANGLVSNPSPIYKVELLKDADDSKLIISEYDFPKKIVSQNSRKFKNLFQITPAVEQIIFDQGQEALFNKATLQGTIDDLKLGIAEQSVWGRKFKFRVKSTTSGKIIDYNITFTLTKNKTEEDF